jgi:nucleoid-associated protein YgaU
MALGTKLGIAVAVVAVGGAGLWGWQHSKKDHGPPDVTASTPPADLSPAAAPLVTVAPEPIRTEPPAASTVIEPVISTPPGESSSVQASPLPPIGAQEASERSFRARPDKNADAPGFSEGPPGIEVTAPRLEPPPAVSETTSAAALSPPTPSAARPEVLAPPAEKAPASQPAVAAAKPIQHVIQAGETYSALAEKYFGSARYVGLIVKANPGKDPRRLLVGSKINIPPAPKDVASKSDGKPIAGGSAKLARVPNEAAPAVPADRAYKVQPGESWNDIAAKFLGDQKRWPELYELNKDRVATNPASLRSGTVIELPAGVKSTTRPS